jgi:hypothetical protein
MNLMLLGAVATLCFTVSLFFMRFWKRTQDRFFLYFAVSFALEGVGRALQGFFISNEQEPLFYLLRLVSFMIILYAILDKNRTTSGDTQNNTKN